MRQCKRHIVKGDGFDGRLCHEEIFQKGPLDPVRLFVLGNATATHFFLKKFAALLYYLES